MRYQNTFLWLAFIFLVVFIGLIFTKKILGNEELHALLMFLSLLMIVICIFAPMFIAEKKLSYSALIITLVVGIPLILLGDYLLSISQGKFYYMCVGILLFFGAFIIKERLAQKTKAQ
jgi:hypothetical protein